MMKTRLPAWVVAAAVSAAACDSPLDTNPTASIDAETALNTARGIELGIKGAYQSFLDSDVYGRNLIAYPDLYADNLDFTGTFVTDQEVGLRAISASNADVTDTWEDSYDGINRANAVLAAIPNAGDLSAEAGRGFRGEALFIRALHYFNLVRLFGGVPLVTEPARGVGPEAQVSRSTPRQVYDMIEKDLEEAVTLLPAGRIPGRATQGAANGLLAKVYLEDGKHAQARDKATLLIGNSAYRLATTYRDLFTTKHSSESIFEITFTLTSPNSNAFWFFTQALGGRYGYAPSLGLFNAFETGDPRRAATIGMSGASRYANKYFRIANQDDNVIVVRLADMYLTRAEANARLGADAATVRADVNVVRRRAGLADLPATVATQAALLDAILKERRVEFATEGHRFFDLKRLGVAEQVLGISANRLLWPIPQSERDVNPNLEQNPGY